MEVRFLAETTNTDVSIVVGVFDNNELSPAAEFLNDTTNGLLKAALEKNRFRGREGETLALIAPNDLKVNRILVVGFGKRDKINELRLQNIGGHAYAALKRTPETEVVLHLGDLSIGAHAPEMVAAHVAAGFHMRSWSWDKYKTTLRAEDKSAIKRLTVVTDHAEAAAKAYTPLEAVVSGMATCKRLQSEPGNILNPSTYPDMIKEELKGLDVSIEVLGEKELAKLGMGALLGVGQGSVHESKVVVMRYHNGPSNQAPVAFVGKGVTFDTGGVDLKPMNKMEEMIFDMSGSATVVGTMKALAKRQAKVNAVGLVGIVENMLDGNAQRPGDIVTTMAGKTVEITNTDAEGRLVLADVLWYAQKRFKPQFMIDIATLTGAIIVTFADQHSGLFSNNDELAKQITKSGDMTGDYVWRLPLGAGYNKLLDSTCADLKNAVVTRSAGSITAAQFLEHFVNQVPWAHLDIAGTSHISDRQLATSEKGATAVGVKLLDHLVRENYESA